MSKSKGAVFNKTGGRDGKTFIKLYYHASLRFSQRYNKELTLAFYEELINKIKDGKSEAIQKQSSNKTVHLVDSKYYVVYDKKRSAISTFLTKKMVDERLNKEKK